MIIYGHAEVFLLATFAIQNLDVLVACKVPKKPSDITHCFIFNKVEKSDRFFNRVRGIFYTRACRPIALKLVTRAFTIS